MWSTPRDKKRHVWPPKWTLLSNMVRNCVSLISWLKSKFVFVLLALKCLKTRRFGTTVPSSVEDAVTLNACHFIQMWQHLKRALEEFAQIKLKSMFMPRGCRVLHLKIRWPSALRQSLVLWRPARTTATIISSVVWPGDEKCLATGRSAFFARATKEIGDVCTQAI